MAIPINIENLLHKRVVESTRIEFKSDFNPNPIIHSICAFANDIDNMGGGYILIGVEEQDGVPVFPIKGIPIEQVDSILKNLVSYCRCIEPLYNPIVEPILYHDVYIIVVWVPGGHGRPYKASVDVLGKDANKNTKFYYIRKFSSTLKASPEEEKELFYISSDIPFDDRPNLAADTSDLDVSLMRSHLKEIGSTLYEQSIHMDSIEIAKDLQLVSGPTENLKPLNVGILMFSERPEKYFRYARIEVVDIPNPNGMNMTERIFTGPIQRQLKDALAYIKNYTIVETILKNPQKAEADRICNYPFSAIEEILANAVYHRSYQINEPITVRITPNSIEITSFPGFDRSISDDSISNYSIRSKKYRNRRIGDFLKELKLIEGRNTGFPTAIQSLKENGSGMLRFDMDTNRTYLTVTIPVHPYYIQSTKISKEELYEQKILSILHKEPLSLTELAIEMGYKSITAKLRRTVNKMLDYGILYKTITECSTVKLTVK